MCPAHVKVNCLVRLYLVALVDVVVDQLQQKPHDISQDEGGDQVPVDDVSQTPYAPVSQVQQETHFTLSFDGDQEKQQKQKSKGTQSTHETNQNSDRD